jgi:hypothetical protein
MTDLQIVVVGIACTAVLWGYLLLCEKVGR